MSPRYQTFIGAEVAEIIDDLARLRITVFRDWPYLYDGDLAYERAYLQRYVKPGVIVVGAFDDAEMVGAATGMPLIEHADDFAAAFAGQDIDFKDVFYCAESVLLPAYRGHGVGHHFFDAREAYAKAEGFPFSAFCGVIRPESHPSRPAGYRPLDPFWRKRGYSPVPGVIAHFKWRDIGDDAETEKPLQFWMKALT